MCKAMTLLADVDSLSDTGPGHLETREMHPPLLDSQMACPA